VNDESTRRCDVALKIERRVVARFNARMIFSACETKASQGINLVIWIQDSTRSTPNIKMAPYDFFLIQINNFDLIFPLIF